MIQSLHLTYSVKTVHLRVYNGVAFIVYFFCAKLSIFHFILSKGENCYDTKLASDIQCKF